MSDKLNFDLSEIQKNAETLDSEALHMYLLEQVKNEEFDSCLEALANYVEKNDIDIYTPTMVKKYISPSLYGILYREALERSMLKEQCLHMSIEDFF